MLSTTVSHQLTQLMFLTTEDQGGLQRFSDLNGGKMLLEWLSAQVSTKNGPVSAGDELLWDDDDEQAINSGTPFRDMLLEKEELSILNDVKFFSIDDANASTLQTSEAPADYVPPSRLKKHAGHINSETVQIKQEATELRTKISQTKDACKKLAHSAKLLRNAAYTLASDVQKSENNIMDISITVDATINSTLNDAQSLLCDLGLFNKSTNNSPHASSQVNTKEKTLIRSTEKATQDFEMAKSLLLRTQTNLSNMTRDVRLYLMDYQQLREQEAEILHDLDHETGRLSKAFRLTQNPMPKVGRSSGRNQALLKEMQEILVILEREDTNMKFSNSSEFLDACLSRINEWDGIKSYAEKGVSVEELINNAWRLDQAAIIKHYEEKFDEVVSLLNSALSPLEQLHGCLYCIVHCAQDVEATLEALGEELREISVESNTHIHDDYSGENIIFEQDLKLMLTDCKNLNQDIVSPRVFFEKEDVLTQLHVLKAKFGALEVSEKAWTDKTIRKYSLRPLHPLLTHIYSYSPLNNCPPFEVSQDIRELEARTRSKTTELQILANSLEEEVHETFRKDTNSRRLNNFLDKWSSSNLANFDS